MTCTPLTESDLSYHTDGLSDRDTYLTVASACLSEALPGDLTGWYRVDLANPPVKVWYDDPQAYRMGDVRDAVIAEHPVVAHRLAHPESEPVLRVSDRISDRVFRSSRVYREVFVPLGARYQLTISTDGDDTVTSGWIVKRSVRDFTETDLRHARRLQPLLALLNTIYSYSPVRRTDSARIEEARRRARLTVRELDVLTLLANGLSAHQIARLRRISVRTVRKHLENIYQKLGCHDRLLAVNKARSLGLLRSAQGALAGSGDRTSHPGNRPVVG
ncbi:MAG: response regulator transcription factor [Pseudonocardiales bacterium]|nr:response regulator transcription factor [Pseudonocardiales bacterium]MBV9029718.1 response regulator transcription factor [Pseudonocardiales bacterium]MBW0008577.1 response regulator transcription factor [Pseudonocardiales bacterium]